VARKAAIDAREVMHVIRKGSIGSWSDELSGNLIRLELKALLRRVQIG